MSRGCVDNNNDYNKIDNIDSIGCMMFSNKSPKVEQIFMALKS